MRRLNRPFYPSTTAALNETLDKFLKVPSPTPIPTHDQIIRQRQEIEDRKEIAERFDVNKAIQDALTLRDKNVKQ
jgi:hypothetical protein